MDDITSNNSPTGVSIFVPHHITHVFYPSIALLENENDEVESEFALAPIYMAADRYDPSRPLVEDVAVEHHSGRNSRAELSFYSITPACFGSTTLWAKRDEFTDDQRLLHDMRLATSGNGSTTLQVVTYTVPDLEAHLIAEPGKQPPEADAPMIRIFRCTMFKQGPSMKPEDHTHGSYNMGMAVFDAIDCEEEWMLHLRDLINGYSDRAVRYVATQLEEQHTDNPAIIWKPPRMMMFEERLKEFTKLVDPAIFADPDVDRHCISCTSDLLTEDAEPLSLLCNGHHIVCRDCIIQWCNAQGPAFVSCPYCRRKLIADQVTIDWLRYGICGKAYKADDRYNDWENFERSCADLDAHLAENNNQQLTVIGGVLSMVWNHLATAAKLELEDSTPYELQAVRAPEYDLLRESIESTLSSYDGVNLQTSTIYKLLLEEVRRVFARAVLRSSLTKALPVAEIDVLVQQPLRARLGLRPGFMEFTKRMISRMLYFAHLRICECDGGDEVFHYHGLRECYSLEKANGERKRTNGTR